MNNRPSISKNVFFKEAKEANLADIDTVFEQDPASEHVAQERCACPNNCNGPCNQCQVNETAEHPSSPKKP